MEFSFFYKGEFLLILPIAWMRPVSRLCITTNVNGSGKISRENCFVRKRSAKNGCMLYAWVLVSNACPLL
jgi:hypothetical protein